ncbi:MAG: tRNA guanosine(34) transglycosylase Tgt [Nanoarchaeota archaeon]
MFKITHQDGKARVGKLKTAHGTIETPFFMPVATRASGKYITTDDYKTIPAKAIISNSFLLSLKPGIKTMEKAGGIHHFMNFNKVIFTDCGGFQMSRNIFIKKSKKGLHFRSPFDNSKIVLTPEKIMNIQLTINSDVAMMLDDMSPYGISKEEAKAAMENTHRWGKESLQFHQELKKQRKSKQLLFGIVQGNFYPDLREESAKFINSLDFDGIAIGGVAIGEPKKEMYQAVDAALPFITEDRPRYVMGVGSPEEILSFIEKGIDCFDSIYPTQNARHNALFTSTGTICIEKQEYAHDFTSIEPGCGCHTCQNYTKAYLYHLVKIKEPVAMRLQSIHNLFFVLKLVEDAKKAIKEKRFAEFKKEFSSRFN